MPSQRSEWLYLPLPVAYLFVGLGSYGLLDNNEGLYAEIAREMLAGGDWIIPHLNGVPYIEKPPLLYYLMAASMALLGESEFAVRLVSAISALGCFLAVLWFGRRNGRRHTGNLAGLILLSGFGFIVLSRTALFDMLLTALLNAALFASFLAWKDHDRRLLWAAHVLLALAVLAKGLVAILLFGWTWAIFLATGERREFIPALRFLLDPLGLALFAVVAAPWHIAASWAHPGFAWFYFVNEHLLRFLGQRQPHDYYSGSVFYYLPRIFLYLFPWTLLLPLLIAKRAARVAGEDGLKRFLWSFFLGALLFFSLSSAKANYYMVVAMPALALLLAMTINATIEGGRGNRIAILLSLTVPAALSIVVVRIWLISRGQEQPVLPPDFLPMAIGVAAFSILGSMATVFAWRRHYHVALFTIALMLAPPMGYFLFMVQANEAYISARPLAKYLESQGWDGKVFLYRDFERISALRFYLKHPLSIIDSASNDLWYGQRREGGGKERFVSLESYLESARSDKGVVVVCDERLDEFRRKVPALQVQPAGRFGRVTVFAGCGEAGCSARN